jgi:hypothetical protein
VTVDPFTGQFTSVFADRARGGVGMPDPNIRRQWDNAPGTVFSRGIGRGIDTIQRNLGSTIEGLGNTTGIQALSTYGAGSVARNQAEIDASRAMENDSIATFLGSILAENAPQTASSVGLPVAGAAIGSVVPGVGTVIGAGIGTAASFLFNYGQLTGENREAQKAENARLGVDTPVDEGAAFGTAVGQSALETLGGVLQARLATRASREASRLFSREGATQVARSAAQGAAVEGATEVGQQAGTRVQAGQDLTSAEAIQDLAIAGLAGSILGGTLAGGGSAAGIALRPQERVAGTTNDDLIERVDNALTPASARPTADAAPADLFGDTITEPQRPFADMTDANIFTALQAAQTSTVQENMARDEADPLGPAGELIAQLRAEAEIRGLEVTPQVMDTGALFEGQTKQDLNKTLRALSQQTELSPQDTQLQTALQAELRRREAATVDPQLTMIRPNAPPSQSRTALQNPARAELFAEARRMGLPKGTTFEKQSKARTMEELYDEVVEAVETETSDGPTEKLAEGMGMGRDLDAEIAQAQQARDTIELPRNTDLQTAEGLQAYAEAMQARQQADTRVTELVATKQRLQDAYDRRAQRLDDEATTAALVGDPEDALSLRQAFAVNPEDGPSWVDRYTDLPAELSSEQQAALTPAAAEGSFGTVFAEALNTAQRARLARRAELDQQEQQFTQAERARMEQEIRPTEVTGRKIEGSNVTVSFTRGAPVTLERRDGQWFNGTQPVGRKLDAAITAVRESRDVEAGFLMQRRGPLNVEGTNVTAPPGPVRTQQVKGAIQQAMSRIGMTDTNIYVVANPASLPVEVASEQSRDLSQGGRLRPISEMLDEGTNAMASDNGSVAIFADKVQTKEDAVALLFHEVLGHRGMAAMFGQDRANAIMNLYDNSPALQEMHEQWMVAVGPEAMEFYGQMPLWVQVEEAIAVKAESGPIRASYMQRMKQIIRKFARLLGLKSKAISDGELTAILAEAHRRAMRGEGVNVGKRPAPAEIRMNPIPETPAILAAAQTYGDPNTSTQVLRMSLGAVGGLPDTPQGNSTAIGRIMKVADTGRQSAWKWFRADASESLRTGALYVQSLGDIVSRYGNLFPMKTSNGRSTNAVAYFSEARDLRTSVQMILSRLGKIPHDNLGKLSAKSQKDTQTLMNATFVRLDPRKSLEAHDHLSPQERMELRSEYAEARAAWVRLGRAGDRKVYDDMIAMNEATYYQQHTLDLYDAIREIPELRANIPAAQHNPVRKFVEASKSQDNPDTVREFWRNEAETLLTQTERFLAANKTRQQGQSDAGAVSTLMGAVESQVGKTKGQLRQMEQYPYFHIGRFGPYFTTFKMKTVVGPDGKRVVDPRAREAVSRALDERGFHNIELNENADGASVFIRTENRSGANDLVAMARELMPGGYVIQEPNTGTVDQANLLPESARRTVDALEAEIAQMNQPVAGEDQKTIDAKRKYLTKVKEDLRAAYLNRLPDRSAAKVMAQRKFRAGYDKDMVRAYAQRQQIAATSTASRMASDMIGEALTAMEAEVRDAQGPDVWAKTSILRELYAREQESPDSALSGFFDGFRAMNHNYFLAMNPGYWLTQITQVQTNTWPELVKAGVSWRRAQQSLMKSVDPASKIVKATMAIAKQQGFKEHGADPTITTEVLRTVQLDPDPKTDQEIKDFVMYMVNTGSIDIGSAARALGRAAEGQNSGKFDTVMRWSASGSYYLEMTTRLVAALASRDVAISKGEGIDGQRALAKEVIHESLFNYSESNRARAFGRRGIIKEGTPLATAFLSFQFYMVEKYFREFGMALGIRDGDPATRAEARRWLGSHLVAMGTLAGSLGLPFVTVIARLIDGLGDLLDDSEEPFQVKIAYRNFLADTFGEDVAEVMARGLPRAVGFDISQRIGAADILPFSQLIADRRRFDEAFGAMAERTWGSAPQMLSDMIVGGNQIADGNVFEGLRMALPLGLRNPLNAVKLGTDGFTDSRNNILPMDPTTSDIVFQLVGLSPAQRAEYSEANFAQSVRRGVVTRTASAIRKRIQNAVLTGNSDALREAIAEASEFDQGVDPSFRILPNVSRSVGQATSRQELARLIGAPLGVRATDQTGRELTGFMNTR